MSRVSVYSSRGYLSTPTCARAAVAPRGKARPGSAKRRPSIQDKAPSKRSLPGQGDKTPARGACRDDRARIRPFKSKVYKTEDRDPDKRSLSGRPNPGTTREARHGAPCAPARPDGRRAIRRRKTTTAASHLPRQIATSGLRSSSPAHASLRGFPQGHVAGHRAAWGMRWHAATTVASGGAPNGPPRCCPGDRDGHLMPLSPTVRSRYDNTVPHCSATVPALLQLPPLLHFYPFLLR